MVATVPKLIGPGSRQIRSEKGLMVLGVDLADAREELFVRMVVDGVAIGIAFVRAGFTAKSPVSATKLWALPRCQERARAILDARATTGIVTLPEVTDMLKRVFSGAYNDAEYSAAHNAAFSLARLYGHVTDRSTLEVVRRPSRDPDAPSEMALGDWVAALPALNGPGPSSVLGQEGPLHGARAEPLGQGPEFPNDFNGLNLGPSGPGPSGPELSNDFKGLAPAAGRPENGAPTSRVTVTPDDCGPSPLLEKGAPLQHDAGTSTTTGENEFPSAEDLFG